MSGKNNVIVCINNDAQGRFLLDLKKQFLLGGWSVTEGGCAERLWNICSQAFSRLDRRKPCEQPALNSVLILL